MIKVVVDCVIDRKRESRTQFVHCKTLQFVIDTKLKTLSQQLWRFGVICYRRRRVFSFLCSCDVRKNNSESVYPSVYIFLIFK